MFCRLRSATLLGIDASIIEVEVDLKKGLPQQSIVGLPDPAVREARERVNAAIRNSGFQFPLGSLTVNLAPADVKKVGSCFDLAIAVGILLASEQVALKLDIWGIMLLGELSLDGSLKPVRGVLAIVEMAKEMGFHTVFLPAQNATEASLLPGISIQSLHSLRETVEVLTGERTATSDQQFTSPRPARDNGMACPDFSDVRGQNYAIRAVAIAAAGGHNLLFIGPPGSGKTMIASRIPGILPPMSDVESLETTKIYSILVRSL